MYLYAKRINTSKGGAGGGEILALFTRLGNAKNLVSFHNSFIFNHFHPGDFP